jgi:RimJ/RimL family protein N-acetyltransferase
MPEMETERLILRKFGRNDIGALFDIYSDKDANFYLPWFPLTSLEEAKTFYEKHYANQNGYNFAICQKFDNIPIGYVNVGDADSYDLGYGSRKEYWHRGFVTEACKAVIKQLEKSDIPYITATHDINNSRSGNVMKNIGMTYRYSYEEQWQPKNIVVIFRMYQLNINSAKHQTYMGYWEKYNNHFIEQNL